MRRRDFLATMVGGVTLLLPRGTPALSVHRRADWFLVPMDDDQEQHLKAYGLVYRALERGEAGEWLLNYRGGSFLIPASEASQRDAALEGITLRSVVQSEVTAIKGEIQASNREVVPLEKAPKMAVYVPTSAAPWDDAVVMALEFAGIRFERVWDREVIAQSLPRFDWLHLHHEDFTGQFSKFGRSADGLQEYQAMVREQTLVMRELGFASVPDIKRAVAWQLRSFVEQGGFLFAMCTATETLDLALASRDVSIVPRGAVLDPAVSARLDWSQALAFQDGVLEPLAEVAAFSDIDGHQVNTTRRQELGAFTLFNFSAKIDPVATMLVQNHRQVIPDFYGLTTSFRRSRIKPAVTVLGEELGAAWVKYIHGERGKGTWTFYGGHDPEDPRHAIGDPPTDLTLHPQSPGYRLILNNVLFPAARKKELKT